MRAAIARFPIASFTIVAFVISWGIWLPLLMGSALPPPKPWPYMLWFTASILPISCLATWIFNGSGESVPAVTLFHIAVNLADYVVVLPGASGESVLLSTSIITALVVGVIVWRDRNFRLRPARELR